MKTLVEYVCTKESTYVYDAISNQIISISGNFARPLTKRDEFAVTNYLKSKDVISESKIKEAVWIDSFSEYTKMLDGKIPSLVLELGQACNLRCDYCVYSGNYENYRTHNATEMGMDMAKKAIDFFHFHNREAEKAAIFFFGGEPLLWQDAIKSLVDYAKSIFGSKPLNFSASTNGTLITTDFLSWLRTEPAFDLYVTLNGYHHDKYRHFPDSRGSLATILEGIFYARDHFPDVYNRQIKFLCNVDSFSEMLDVRNFYTSHALHTPATTSFIMRRYGNEKIESILHTDMDRENAAFESLVDLYISRGDAFCHSHFSGSLMTIHNRNMAVVNECVPIERTCQPFGAKLFVDAKGRFHICERTNSSIHLGDIQNGFDIEGIKTLMDSYRKISSSTCIDCPVQRLCPRCLAAVINGDSFCSIPDDICKKIRLSILRELRIYCEISERNPDLLQTLDRMK